MISRSVTDCTRGEKKVSSRKDVNVYLSLCVDIGGCECVFQREEI